MGLTYLLAEEFKDAISCFGSALAIDSENVDAMTYLAMAELKLGNLENCLKNVEAALGIRQNYERALHVKGLYFEAQGNLRGAITWIEGALTVNPKFIPGLMDLGRISMLLEKREESINALTQILKIDREQPYAHQLIGDIYYKEGQYEYALHHYEQAVVLKGEDPSLWIKKGNTHRIMKSYKEASDAYHKAINADPENTEAWVKCGEIMLLLNEQDTALEYFNTALALNPKDSTVSHKRGRLYFSLERFEEALDDFDNAFSSDPGNPEHLYYRALILENLDRNDEAKRTWQVAAGLYNEEGNVTKAAECNARARNL
jgi:tetratricopeptide (TPR) repeat protein